MTSKRSKTIWNQLYKKQSLKIDLLNGLLASLLDYLLMVQKPTFIFTCKLIFIIYKSFWNIDHSPLYPQDPHPNPALHRTWVSSQEQHHFGHIRFPRTKVPAYVPLLFIKLYSSMAQPIEIGMIDQVLTRQYTSHACISHNSILFL